MTFSQRIVIGFFKGLTNLICRFDDAELVKIPAQGPLIIYTNHVNLVEIPIIYTHLQPRRVHGMLLADRWKLPLVSWALDVAEAIPLHRGEADVVAIRKGLEVLERGEMLIIAPEGTRSHDGTLQGAHSGVVLLALHSCAPLIPMAYFGAEKYTQNLSHLHRTDFHIRVGEPFRLEAGNEKPSREVREQMTEEMMYQLGSLLPPQYRGRYADASLATSRFLVFGT